MKLFIDTDNRRIDFNVQYRSRKTLSIQIDPSGKVLVIAPKGLSQEVIKEMISSKSKWILKKLEELKEIGYKPKSKRFEDGEAFMYLGKEYPLKVEIDDNIKKPEIVVLQEKIYIRTPADDKNLMRIAMEKWYREMCLVKIIERVEHYKGIIGKEPTKIRVKEQKKRWGSCTSKKHVLFNWRCIMAPIDIVDYIVVHEMCHLIQMNHSKAFWGLVESILPDYKERRDWLKKYGIVLDM